MMLLSLLPLLCFTIISCDAFFWDLFNQLSQSVLPYNAVFRVGNNEFRYGRPNDNSLFANKNQNFNRIRFSLNGFGEPSPQVESSQPSPQSVFSSVANRDKNFNRIRFSLNGFGEPSPQVDSSKSIFSSIASSLARNQNTNYVGSQPPNYNPDQDSGNRLELPNITNVNAVNTNQSEPSLAGVSSSDANPNQNSPTGVTNNLILNSNPSPNLGSVLNVIAREILNNKNANVFAIVGGSAATLTDLNEARNPQIVNPSANSNLATKQFQPYFYSYTPNVNQQPEPSVFTVSNNRETRLPYLYPQQQPYRSVQSYAPFDQTVSSFATPVNSVPQYVFQSNPSQVRIVSPQTVQYAPIEVVVPSRESPRITLDSQLQSSNDNIVPQTPSQAVLVPIDGQQFVQSNSV